jgi:hypothetical protein
LWLTIATEKIGASVDSEPSIRPTIAGWTRWRRKWCSSDIEVECSELMPSD